MEFISTPLASAPGGHYAQAVADHGFLFISGQLPVRADGTPSAHEPFREQARLALANLLAILNAAGCQRADILKVTVYLVDVPFPAAMQKAYLS